MTELKNQEKVKEAFEIIKQAMKDDCPQENGSYAHSWHCNIAMMCYDAIRSAKDQDTKICHLAAHEIGNDAASRFMKLCFDVNTSQ